MKMTAFVLAFLAAVPTLVTAEDFTKIIEGEVVNDDRYSEGSSWGDVNNDHLLDLFVPDAYEERSNLMFLNNGDGTFTPIGNDPVVTDTNASSGGCFGDFDNDGDLDLFVQNYFGRNSSLYMNQGGGSFTRVTTGDIVNDGGWSFNSSTADYDNDGNLDIFVDNGAFTVDGESNFLYRGLGDGTFEKITTGDIVNDGEKSLSSAWCDYDDDGDQDLFVANSDPFGGVEIDNFLYRNEGDGTFTKLEEGILVTDGGVSTGVSWGDYDNDGDFDLFVANYANHDNALYQNMGDGTFVSVTTGAVVSDGGYSVAGAWGDFDNDGDLDLFVTNDWDENNFFYENHGDGTFERVTTGIIVSDGGRSNGATWADYDNDGDLDLFVPNGRQPYQSNFLYRNNGLTGYNWINIVCVGTASNASGIGAKIRSTATVGGGSLRQLRGVFGQTGFNAQNSFNVEFGLRDASIVDSLVIEWPSGTIDSYGSVAVNRFYRAVEGAGLDDITTNIRRGRVSDSSSLPKTGKLGQNYPNPFNPSTVIPYEVRGAADVRVPVRLVIYDVRGKKVRTLVEAELEPGSHRVLWKGLDERGRPVRSGVYFYELRTVDEIFTKKLLLLR